MLHIVNALYCLTVSCKFKMRMLFTHPAGNNMHFTWHKQHAQFAKFSRVIIIFKREMVLHYKFIQRNLELLEFTCI